MFFKKKKSKLDPKVRFQHKQFKSKLDSARSYKRTSRAIPESSFDRVMTAIGLPARWSQILVLVLFAGLFYLAYVPNFLSIESIHIQGLSDAQAQDLEASLRRQIADSHFFNPQHNILFFDKDSVDRALADVPSVHFIASLNKDIRGRSLYIEAESKYDRFLLAAPEQVFDVYNDGSLHQQSGVSRIDWDNHLNQSMIKVRLYQNLQFSANQAVFHRDLFAYMNRLIDVLAEVEGQQLAYLTFREPALPQPVAVEQPITEDLVEEDGQTEEVIEPVVVEPQIPNIQLPFNSSEVHAVFYKNNDLRSTYRVIFDATADAQKSADELRLLLSQTAPDRYDQLFYVDLRIPEKAFLCLENTACAK